MRNAFKTNIDADQVAGDGSTIAHIGIAPGVVETIVATAAAEVPGVAEVGGPKVEKRFNSVLSRNDTVPAGVDIIAEDGHIVLDIHIQLYYGYKLQEVVDGIRSNVSDALASQAGIQIEAINVYVSALQIEE